MAQAQIIDGKQAAETLRSQVAKAVAELKRAHGIKPGLAVVLVGEDPASALYVANKSEQSKTAGMHSVTHRMPADSTQEEVLAMVSKLNADPAIHGILCQLPLPSHLDSSPVIAAIDPNKDVDGLTVTNAGRLASGLPGLAPCTPVGCMILIRSVMADLKGRRALVLGRSNLIGKPMVQLLLQADCTVTIAHSRTKDLAGACREAEILVAAVGRPEMVRGDWIRPGAVVIDVGINRVPARDPEKAAAGKTRVVGDVAFDEAMETAGYLTPVPGSVGPMTIACLLRNTVTAACLIHDIKSPLD